MRPLAGPHHADGALFSIGRSFDVERDQLVEPRTYAIPGECGNVDEEVARAFGLCDEAEAPVIVPLGQGTVGSHDSRLTAPFSGRPLTHQHAGAQDLFKHFPLLARGQALNRFRTAATVC